MIICALPLLGCGGGSMSTVSGSPQVASASFTKKLEALCELHLTRQEKKSEKFVLAYGRAHGTVGQPVSHAQLEEQLLKVIVPNVERYMDELRGLDPPPRYQRKVERLLEALQNGVEAARADQSWIIDDDPEPFRPARTIGAQLGDEHCGQP